MFSLLLIYFAQICGWWGNLVLDSKTERCHQCQLRLNVISPYSYTRIVEHCQFNTRDVNTLLFPFIILSIGVQCRGLGIEHISRANKVSEYAREWMRRRNQTKYITSHFHSLRLIHSSESSKHISQAFEINDECNTVEISYEQWLIW